MWIEAILSKADLVHVVGEACPLRIKIGDDGHVALSGPRDLELVPEVGLQMTVTAEIHWPVLGIQVPVSVRSATLEMRPEITKTPTGDALTFKLRLDDVDISILPAIVDRGIVDLVNKELVAKHVELSWGFTRTLSHVFDLPDALVSIGALDLRATEGRVKITGEALALAVRFAARVEPRTVPRPGAPEPLATPPPLALPLPGQARGLRGLLSRYPAGLAAPFGAALGMGVLVLVRASRRPRTLLQHLRALTT